MAVAKVCHDANKTALLLSLQFDISLYGLITPVYFVAEECIPAKKKKKGSKADEQQPRSKGHIASLYDYK